MASDLIERLTTFAGKIQTAKILLGDGDFYGNPNASFSRAGKQLLLEAATALAIERERAEKAEKERDERLEELGRVIMACPQGMRTSPASDGVKQLRASLAEAKRLLVETQRQMFGLYQAINPHAYYTTGEGIAMNRFADADTTVQQVRRFLAQEEGRPTEEPQR